MRKSIAKRIRLIKCHRLYSSKELAGELGVHQRTVQQWQKQGMKPVDSDCKPFLFRGHDAKSFLSTRRKARKQKLQDGEFYCTKCRQPVRSIPKAISLKELGTGTRLLVKGMCKKCGTSINRFMGQFEFRIGVFEGMPRKADTRLYESQYPLVNTDMSKELTDE